MDLDLDLDLRLRNSDGGIEDSTRTTLTDINSELPTYDQVANVTESGFPGAYHREMRESPHIYRASTNIQTGTIDKPSCVAMIFINSVR